MNSEGLRRRVERLDRIPLRPATVRSLLESSRVGLCDEVDIAPPRGTEAWRSLASIDPGWVLSRVAEEESIDSLELIAKSTWWLPSLYTGGAGDFLVYLWRHSLAIAASARRIAREAGDPDPELVGRAGFVSRLGLWAVAAVDIDWLVSWWQCEDPAERRKGERAEFGLELPDLGRWLAERWGCSELIIDAAWLHHPRAGTLTRAASDPVRIGYLQQACEWVEQMPWSFDSPADPDRMPAEPRLKIVVAEVQARTASEFVAADATAHEERACRRIATLETRLSDAERRTFRSDRFLNELSNTGATVTLDEWASRAALAWCAEPGVTAARVVWNTRMDSVDLFPQDEVHTTGDREQGLNGNMRRPSLIVPVYAAGRNRGELQVWTAASETSPIDRMQLSTEWRAWQAWAELIAGRESSEYRIRQVVEAHREQGDSQDSRLNERKLDALGEFAGGAGHELNNPLAVIAGRAQLLMARTSDPHATKSLKVIQAQVKRAHQILRDLMFVARPPEPKQRMCRPTEVLRACFKDFQEPCAARGVRLVGMLDESVPATWADFDGLRHVGEVLLRNALQATPEGGGIQVQSMVAGSEFVWRISDTGHGIGPEEGKHLFDPFYCGRQAGRGLGLGLPRAARIVEQGQGRLQWTSHPGTNTVFSVYMPIRSAPDIAAA